MSDLSAGSTHGAKRKCVGHKDDGTPCGNWPIRGATVCGSHGGHAPQVKKKALVRTEVMAWGLNDETVDPGLTLLHLVAQSRRRATRYALLLEADFADKQVAALVGSAYDEGGHKSGDYMKGLAVLEAQERDRCARFSHLAHSAGIAADQLRIAETFGAQIIDVLRSALTKLGHDPDAPEVRVIVGEALRAIA